ncbi:PP_RS20740 family protein [Pseudomonas mandelii]|uniref:Uncharacterized protein n=1 Tax=Pseudomonas mandelii TaxID=75612 RepID=A0AB36D0I9_9PSED|nr:hypothetical protein [Pseudomonas mandelii]NMZ81953.1 hypothetical protein [Pseudomonas mandelii]
MNDGFQEFGLDVEDFGLSEEEEPAEASVESEEIAQAEALLPVTFLPWHKPRKQWVRDKQWWGQINSHILPNLRGMDTVRYFGLPGDDLLDVRYLQQKLSGSGKSVFILGLLSNQAGWEAAQKQLSKALDSDGIHRDSAVEKLNFDHLENPQSLAYQKMAKIGYFDVVNLDFCGNVIGPQLKSRRLDAIKNLLGYQFQVVPQRWLLFLTTRSSRATSCLETFNRLAECLDQNLTVDEFWDEFNARFDTTPIHANRCLDRPALDGQDFIDVYTIGLFKFIVGLAVKNKFKIKMDSVVKYDIEGEEASSDMISMCLVFTKVLNRPDGTAQEELTEPDMALRGLKKLKEMRCVDEIIVEDIDKYVACVKQKIILLEQSGRNVTGYVEEVCIKDIGVLGVTVEELNRRLAAL